MCLSRPPVPQQAGGRGLRRSRQRKGPVWAFVHPPPARVRQLWRVTLLLCASRPALPLGKRIRRRAARAFGDMGTRARAGRACPGLLPCPRALPAAASAWSLTLDCTAHARGRAMVNIPDMKLREAAYCRLFNLGWSAKQVHKSVFTLSDGSQLYSLRHVQRLVAEFKITFSPRPPSRTRRARSGKFAAEEVAWLKIIVDGDPSLYLDEIQDQLRDEYGCMISRSTICRTIHKPVLLGGLGYNLKVLEVQVRQRIYRERLLFLQRMRLWGFALHQILNLDERRITRGGGADGAKLVDRCNCLRALGAAGVALPLRPVTWMAL